MAELQFAEVTNSGRTLLHPHSQPLACNHDKAAPLPLFPLPAWKRMERRFACPFPCFMILFLKWTNQLTRPAPLQVHAFSLLLNLMVLQASAGPPRICSLKELVKTPDLRDPSDAFSLPSDMQVIHRSRWWCALNCRRSRIADINAVTGKWIWYHTVSNEATFCSKSKIHFLWQVHKPILTCTGVGSDLSTRAKITR